MFSKKISLLFDRQVYLVSYTSIISSKCETIFLIDNIEPNLMANDWSKYGTIYYYPLRKECKVEMAWCKDEIISELGSKILFEILRNDKKDFREHL